MVAKPQLPSAQPRSLLFQQRLNHTNPRANNQVPAMLNSVLQKEREKKCSNQRFVSLPGDILSCRARINVISDILFPAGFDYTILPSYAQEDRYPCLQASRNCFYIIQAEATNNTWPGYSKGSTVSQKATRGKETIKATTEATKATTAATTLPLCNIIVFLNIIIITTN